MNDELNAFLHAEPAEGDFTVAVKDVIDVAGMPTTAASKILRRVPERTRRASPGSAPPARRSSASSTRTSSPTAR